MPLPPARRVPPIRIEESIEIGRPPEAVWAVVADPTRDPEWCRKVKSVAPAGEDRWEAVHKPIPLRPPRGLSLEQRDRQAATRLSLHQEDEGSVFDIDYRLEPSASGTRLTQVSEFRWHTLPGPIQRLLAPGVRRDVRGQLRALKRLLEG